MNFNGPLLLSYSIAFVIRRRFSGTLTQENETTKQGMFCKLTKDFDGHNKTECPSLKHVLVLILITVFITLHKRRRKETFSYKIIQTGKQNCSI